jgi:hypothetical protein
MWVTAALDAGASVDEITSVLTAVGPNVGTFKMVAAADPLALALGINLDTADDGSLARSEEDRDSTLSGLPARSPECGKGSGPGGRRFKSRCDERLSCGSEIGSRTRRAARLGGSANVPTRFNPLKFRMRAADDRPTAAHWAAVVVPERLLAVASVKTARQGPMMWPWGS